MAEKAEPNTSLTAGVILLAVSCLNIGYGLCMTINRMDNAYLPVGIGVLLSAVAATLIAKSAKMLSEGAPKSGE